MMVVNHANDDNNNNELEQCITLNQLRVGVRGVSSG